MKILKNKSPGGKMEVFLLAYPTVITMLGHGVMGFADSMMVGALGTVELGAVGFANILYFTLVSVFMGTVQIVNTFSSQAYGASDMKGASGWAWQGMYLGLFAWPFLMLICFACRDIFMLLGPSIEVQDLGSAYTRVRLYGSGMFLVMVALIYFYRGVGMVKTPMIGTLVMNIVNIVLDYLLIYGKLGFPAMGVEGAAWASVISIGISMMVLLGIFLLPFMNQTFFTRSTFQPRLRLVFQMVRVGLPAGIQMFLDIASFTVFVMFIGRMGDMELAANQVALQIEFLGFNICHAFSVATTTLVGQHIGAGKIELAVKSTKSAAHILFYYLLALLAIVAIFPADLISLFAKDQGVIANGVTVLYLAMIFMVFNGMGAIATGALRGAGDTRWPMYVSLLAGWAFFLPLAYLLGEVLEGGMFGAWLGATVYIIGVSMTYIMRFKAGNWKMIKI